MFHFPILPKNSILPRASKNTEPDTEIQVAIAGTAYDCPDAGKIWVQLTNKALYFGSKVANTPLGPNQLSLYCI